MDTIIGKIVTSKAGRDKGGRFAVVAIGDGRTVYVADGDVHKLAHPKKKSLKHLSFERKPIPDIEAVLNSKGGVGDAALRRALMACNYIKEV